MWVYCHYKFKSTSDFVLCFEFSGRVTDAGQVLYACKLPRHFAGTFESPEFWGCW